MNRPNTRLLQTEWLALGTALLLSACGGAGSAEDRAQPTATPFEPTQHVAMPAAASALSVSVPAGNPGLRNGDGSLHPRPTPNLAPTLINVVTRASELGYMIDLGDSNNDDRPAIEAVLRDAATTAGSTVFFPDGTYNLKTPWQTQANANLVLTKHFVNLEGQSRAGTILKSSFDDGGSASYHGLMLSGVHDVVVKNFTLTSTWSRRYSTDTDTNNPQAGGLTYALSVGYNSNRGAAYNITIDNVLVEKYRIAGVRIGAGSHDVVVQNSLARNATDVGDGGAGYGFVIQGAGHADASSNPFLGDPAKDTYFVVLEGNRTKGPYIRHGLLLQYWTHNNLATGNTFIGTLLDSIDLHGEDEYANEIASNSIQGALRAGIGLGNNGATHDRTGPYNWLHHNDLAGCAQGITVQFGTPGTTIASNTIRDTLTNTGGPAAGIVLGNAAGSALTNNTFAHNTVAGYASILLLDDPATGAEPAGGPTNWTISGNTVSDSGAPLRNTSAMASGNTIQTAW